MQSSSPHPHSASFGFAIFLTLYLLLVGFTIMLISGLSIFGTALWALLDFAFA